MEMMEGSEFAGRENLVHACAIHQTCTQSKIKDDKITCT